MVTFRTLRLHAVLDRGGRGHPCLGMSWCSAQVSSASIHFDSRGAARSSKTLFFMPQSAK